jgi:hypothetical protein
VRTLLTRQLAAMIDESGIYLQELAQQTGIPTDLLAGIKVGLFEPNQAQLLALVRALASPEEVQGGVFVGPPAAHRRKARPSARPDRDYRNGPPLGEPVDVGAPDPLLIERVDELVPALRDVHFWAGKPSLRDLVNRSQGGLARSSLSEMLNGRVPIPTYRRYRAFLEACGIQDLEPWTFTWIRLAKLHESIEQEAKAG